MHVFASQHYSNILMIRFIGTKTIPLTTFWTQELRIKILNPTFNEISSSDPRDIKYKLYMKYLSATVINATKTATTVNKVAKSLAKNWKQ